MLSCCALLKIPMKRNRLDSASQCPAPELMRVWASLFCSGWIMPFMLFDELLSCCCSTLVVVFMHSSLSASSLILVGEEVLVLC